MLITLKIKVRYVLLASKLEVNGIPPNASIAKNYYLPIFHIHKTK